MEKQVETVITQPNAAAVWELCVSKERYIYVVNEPTTVKQQL